MTKLEEELCRILDFSPQYLSTAINEAVDKSKLQGTWMYVNGKLRYVNTILSTSNTVLCLEFDGSLMGHAIETLDAFIPEAGLYKTELGLLSVIKKSNKTWVKSFKPDNFITRYVQNTTNLSYKEYIAISEATRELVAIDNSGEFWAFGCNKSVANKFDSEVIVTNPKFFQEVLDYVNRKGLQCSVNLQ